jgi:hypothetical protein
MTRSFDDLEREVDRIAASDMEPTLAALQLLACGEETMELWINGRGQVPTMDEREGFRLLALHRQGAKGEPSFNACRETCRELAYQFNLVTAEPTHAETRRRVAMAAMTAKHLCLFVSAKMQVEGLGEFCCAAKPMRATDAESSEQVSIAVST